MTAGGNDDQKGVLDTYGLPIWLYPIFILVVVLFAVCTEWDPEFGEYFPNVIPKY